MSQLITFKTYNPETKSFSSPFGFEGRWLLGTEITPHKFPTPRDKDKWFGSPESPYFYSVGQADTGELIVLTWDIVSKPQTHGGPNTRSMRVVVGNRSFPSMEALKDDPTYPQVLVAAIEAALTEEEVTRVDAQPAPTEAPYGPYEEEFPLDIEVELEETETPRSGEGVS